MLFQMMNVQFSGVTWFLELFLVVGSCTINLETQKIFFMRKFIRETFFFVFMNEIKQQKKSANYNDLSDLLKVDNIGYEASHRKSRAIITFFECWVGSVTIQVEIELIFPLSRDVWHIEKASEFFRNNFFFCFAKAWDQHLIMWWINVEY